MVVAFNQKASLGCVNVENVDKQLSHADCATSLYPKKHRTILSDNFNVLNQLIGVPGYVCSANVGMSENIYVSTSQNM